MKFSKPLVLSYFIPPLIVFYPIPTPKIDFPPIFTPFPHYFPPISIPVIDFYPILPNTFTTQSPWNPGPHQFILPSFRNFLPTQKPRPNLFLPTQKPRPRKPNTFLPTQKPRPRKPKPDKARWGRDLGHLKKMSFWVALALFDVCWRLLTIVDDFWRKNKKNVYFGWVVVVSMGVR